MSYSPATMMLPRPFVLSFLLSPCCALAVDFKKDIAPIFKKHCYECHSEQADKRKAGYVFDDMHTLVLDIGPKGFIVPGDVEESHLNEVLTNAESEKNHMPPESKTPLSSGDIKKIQAWIKEGAWLTSTTLQAPPTGLEKKKWRNTEGLEIEASFVKLDGASVHLKMTDGRVLPYPVEKLSADSQVLIRKELLALSGEKKIATK